MGVIVLDFFSLLFSLLFSSRAFASAVSVSYLDFLVFFCFFRRLERSDPFPRVLRIKYGLPVQTTCIVQRLKRG